MVSEEVCIFVGSHFSPRKDVVYFLAKIVEVLVCFKFKVQRNLMLFRSCLSWTESRREQKKGLILSLICPRIKSMIS